jgi:hypothetical protein
MRNSNGSGVDIETLGIQGAAEAEDRVDTGYGVLDNIDTAPLIFEVV